MGKIVIRRKKDFGELINADFNSPENLAFQQKILKEYTAPAKPIVFLPCAGGKKTGKVYSQCMSHVVMSAVTKNPQVEKIVMSEPLVVVPYRYEGEIPFYNYPPDLLTPSDRLIFIDRAAQFLQKLKQQNPARTTVYYVGSKNHGEILKAANQTANNPFEVRSYVSPKGLIGFSKEAEKLAQDLICKRKPANPLDCIKTIWF